MYFLFHLAFFVRLSQNFLPVSHPVIDICHIICFLLMDYLINITQNFSSIQINTGDFKITKTRQA